MTGRWVKSTTQHNATSPPRRKTWRWLIMCNVFLPCTHTHLTQLFRIHKEFQFPAQDTWETSNYRTEEWLKGVVMDWMVTLWNTLLQTVSWMPSVTLRRGNTAATGSWLYSQWAPTSLCALTHKVRESKGKGRGQGDRSKRLGDHTAQKMFAESILNTVVEVTIYLMPAKLARTSGAGYLVQLFMISSKI